MFNHRQINLLRCLAIGAGLAGCTTISNSIDGSRGNYLVEMALKENPEKLRSQAEAGYAKSQFAYALLLEYGLRGVAASDALSAEYKQRSSNQNNKVLNNGVQVGTHYEVNPIEAESANECMAWLVKGRALTNEESVRICGGADARKRLSGRLSNN